MTVEEVADMLNQAVSLSPSLWSLFDVQVMSASLVGEVTPIELMDVGLGPVAFANVLGLINGTFNDASKRISVVTENSGGKTVRKFVATPVRNKG